MNVIIIILLIIAAFILLGFVVKLLFGLAMLVLFALIAGLIARSVVNYRGSLAFTVVSGIIGGIVGAIGAAILHLPLRGLDIGGLPVIYTLAGTILVVAVAKLFDRPARRLR